MINMKVKVLKAFRDYTLGIRCHEGQEIDIPDESVDRLANGGFVEPSDGSAEKTGKSSTRKARARKTTTEA